VIRRFYRDKIKMYDTEPDSCDPGRHRDAPERVDVETCDQCGDTGVVVSVQGLGRFCSEQCRSAFDNYEPPEPDGECFRGREASAQTRDEMVRAQRLK
jgi:hypothetical protein